MGQILLLVALVGASALVALALASTASRRWVLLGLWMASAVVSIGFYLLPRNPGHGEALQTRIELASMACLALAFGVSWIAHPRAPIWFTLPAAAVGVVTPIGAFLLLIVIACNNGGCSGWN